MKITYRESQELQTAFSITADYPFEEQFDLGSIFDAYMTTKKRKIAQDIMDMHIKEKLLVAQRVNLLKELKEDFKIYDDIFKQKNPEYYI